MQASKRLRKAQNVRPSQVLTESDMWDMIDQAQAVRANMARLREQTRTATEITLSLSYPNGTTHPSLWNWQFLMGKAFPEAEIAVKCWQREHPDWS